MTKLPVVIIIPNGGISVPEELSSISALELFDIFINSDSCANDIFDFGDRALSVIKTDISPLFVDTDRPYHMVYPKTEDGVIKYSTNTGKKIYSDKYYPDEIAVSNILKRYYFPFHDNIEKNMEGLSARLMIECHTMMPVGPEGSPDARKPRPLVSLQGSAYSSGLENSSEDFLAKNLQEILKKKFESEEGTIAKKITLNQNIASGYIQSRYSGKGIPMIRLGLSKSLFLTEKYFNPDKFQVDKKRITELRNKIVTSIELLCKKFI